MGRNTGGIYSLPGSDFVSGTVISSTAVNQKFNDVATALTESLSRTGNGDMLAPLRVPDGSAAIPSMSWSSDIGTGFYLAATSSFRAVILASTVQEWTNLGVSINKPLTVSQAATFSTTLGVTGTTTLTGALVANNTATFNGTTAVTGILNVDSGTLYVDPTNNRVGIGTTAPLTTLAIGTAGVADAVVPVQISAGNAAAAYFSANKGNALGLALGYVNNIAGDSRGAIRNVPNDPISVYVNNNTEVVEFNTAGVTPKTTPASTTSVVNTLTRTNIIKAWASINTGATVAVVEGFNTSGVSAVSTNNVRVTLPSNMASTNYGILLSSNLSTVLLGYTNQTNSTFDINARDTSGATINLNSVGGAMRITVIVMGLQ